LPMQRRQRQIQPTDLKAKAIGVVVRELRDQAGLSQERLSADCGFDRTYISRVERGIINSTVSRLWRIADILGIPLSDVAKRMEAWIVGQEKRAKRPSREQTLENRKNNRF
jgi:transcriptional regulator with XRE-family HTH domain